MTNDRAREIRRHVNERYLTTHGDRWANQNDAQHHAELHRVRGLLVAVDASMCAEGIDRETRDRVVFRLLYGAPPEVALGPDWREAANRAVDRDVQTRRLMETPVHWVGLPDELR